MRAAFRLFGTEKTDIWNVYETEAETRQIWKIEEPVLKIIIF